MPSAQAALIAIDNATGEIKALVGGYDFEDSKFDRATQAMRQTGSSFKVYVYAEALAQGASPFDTVVDEPVTFQTRRPELFAAQLRREIRRAHHAAPRSRGFTQCPGRPPAGQDRNRKCDRAGAKIRNRQSPSSRICRWRWVRPISRCMEHTSAIHRISPTTEYTSIRTTSKRVTSYDGAVLEEVRPNVTDVISPDVARTMVAMLEDVVQFGTGVRAKELGQPFGRQDRNDQRFHRRLVHRLHAADHRPACGWATTTAYRSARRRRARAQRCRSGSSSCSRLCRECPSKDFPNVVRLEKIAPTQTGAGGYARYGSARRCGRAGFNGRRRRRCHRLRSRNRVHPRIQPRRPRLRLPCRPANLFASAISCGRDPTHAQPEALPCHQFPRSRSPCLVRSLR